MSEIRLRESSGSVDYDIIIGIAKQSFLNSKLRSHPNKLVESVGLS